MQSDAQQQQLGKIQNKEILQNSKQDSDSQHLQIHQDEHMKKSGVKASFERGQQSQMLLFESFKSRNQFDNESVDECETFTNDRRKKTFAEQQDTNIQFDLHIKNQIKFPFSQQGNQIDTESIGTNNGGVQSRSKKYVTSGISSVIDDSSSKDEEANNFSQLNDSKKLNKSQHQGEALNDDKNESKHNNNGEKSPVGRNMLYSRRGSRRVPGGMNASGVFGKESAVNTTNNHGKDPPHEAKTNPLIGHKSGFFFAMKMKKYASHLVSKLQSRRYAGLRSRHLQFFNDKTIIPNEENGVFKNAQHGEESDEQEIESSINIKKKIVFMLKNGYSRLISDKYKRYLHKLPLFQPSHTLKLIWDSINMVSITYYLIFFPLRIAFGLDIHDSIASYFALGIIFFDILVYLNTGFYDKGALVTDRIGILIHYLDTRFLSDIFSMIPFLVYDIADHEANLFSDFLKLFESFISLMFLVRVSHLGQIKKKIEERFYQKKTLTHIISLFTLLATTLYIAHLFSCIWIIVAEYKLESQDTWMQFAKVSEDNWLVKYLYSLYFLIITMTTVGYGDIKPQNNLEHLFIIIIVLISSGVFSFSINKIGMFVYLFFS